MNKFIGFYLIVTLTACVEQSNVIRNSSDIKANANQETDLIRENLFGKVKLMSEETYSAKDSLGLVVIGDKMILPISSTYLFSREGCITKRLFYDEHGQNVETIVYVIDSLKKSVELISIDLHGDSSLTEARYYNSQGQIKKSSFANKIGKFMWFSEYNYTSKIIEENRFDHKKKPIDQLKQYQNDSGNIYKAELFSNGELIKSYDYEYDTSNFMTKAVMTRPNEESVTENYIYEVDSEGNWIKKIAYRQNVPLRIVIRRIEYYN